MLFVLKYWRIIGAGIGLLAVLAAGWYIHRQIYEDGVTACETAYKEELEKQAAKARATIVQQGKEYEKIIQDLATQGDSGDGVGRRLSDALDRLRDRAGR